MQRYMLWFCEKMIYQIRGLSRRILIQILDKRRHYGYVLSNVVAGLSGSA